MLTWTYLDYMNGFRCNVTGSTSNVALATPQLPRRCGADPQNDKPEASPGNCTYGAKLPFYWFQAERNNVCVYCCFVFQVGLKRLLHRCSRVHTLHLSITTFTTSWTALRKIYSPTHTPTVSHHQAQTRRSSLLLTYTTLQRLRLRLHPALLPCLL